MCGGAHRRIDDVDFAFDDPGARRQVAGEETARREQQERCEAMMPDFMSL